MKDKLAKLTAGLESALNRFEDALAQPPNEYLRDSCIQRFEFTFELLWKTLKAAAEHEGLTVNSPREAMRAAFKLGLIGDDRGYMEMVEDRNLTSHTYKETTADEIYARLPAHAARIAKVLVAVVQRNPNTSFEERS